MSIDDGKLSHNPDAFAGSTFAEPTIWLPVEAAQHGVVMASAEVKAAGPLPCDDEWRQGELKCLNALVEDLWKKKVYPALHPDIKKQKLNNFLQHDLYLANGDRCKLELTHFIGMTLIVKPGEPVDIFAARRTMDETIHHALFELRLALGDTPGTLAYLTEFPEWVMRDKDLLMLRWYFGCAPV